MKWIVFMCLLLALDVRANSNLQLHLENAYRKFAPEYLNSRINLSRTKASYYSAISSHLPEFSLSFGQRRLNEQTGVPPSNYLDPNRRTERSWELDLNFPLFDRAKFLNIKKGKVEKRAAQDSHKFLDDQVTWKIKSSIGSIYIQKFKIINLNKSIEYFKEIVKAQEVGYKLKAKRVIDLEEAKSNLELLKARKTIEENLYSSSMVQLATLLGKSLRFVEDSFKSITNDKTKLIDILKEHYDLKTIEKSSFDKRLKKSTVLGTISNSKIEKINSKISQSVHWPKLEVRGSFSKQGPSWKDIKDPDNSNRTLGVFVKFPLFQFGKAFADNRVVNDLISQSIHRKRYGLRQIKESSHNTLLQFNREKLRIKILKDHLSSRKRLLLAYREAFKLGRETLNELIKQENNFIESEFALIDSMNNLGSLYYQCKFLFSLTD